MASVAKEVGMGNPAEETIGRQLLTVSHFSRPERAFYWWMVPDRAATELYKPSH